MLIISILTRTTNNTQLICYTRVHVCIVPARWTIKFVFLFLPAVWVLYEFICNQFLSCEYCYNLNTCGCRDRIIIIIIFLQDLNAREPLAHRLLHTWHMCLHCPCWVLAGRTDYYQFAMGIDWLSSVKNKLPFPQERKWLVSNISWKGGNRAPRGNRDSCPNVAVAHAFLLFAKRP